jgi:predicted MPP superfamily phosphohydrolase
MAGTSSLIAFGAPLVGAAVALGLYAWRSAPHRVELVRMPMPLAGLPPELAGRTLLHLSDLHVGPHVDSSYLERAFAEAVRLEPDFVVVTGDFVTYRGPRELAELARVLRAMPRGRLGTVAVLGNHDYGYRGLELDVADEVSRVVCEAGATVLRNEIRTIGGIQFAGLADLWSPEFGPHGQPELRIPLLSERERKTPPRPREARVQSAVAALGAIRRELPTIVLSHNPDAQDLPIWEGVRGWVLAGHTHGGQVKPPLLPPPLLPVRNRRYVAGRFTLGERTMYVSRGLGHSERVRLNVRPELTLFTLETAESIT